MVWEARAHADATVGIYVGEFLAGTVKQVADDAWRASAVDFFGDLQDLPASPRTLKEAGGAVYDEYLELEALDITQNSSLEMVTLTAALLGLVGLVVLVLWRVLM